MDKNTTLHYISSEIRSILMLSGEFDTSSLLAETSFTEEEIESMEIYIDTKKSILNNIMYINHDLQANSKMSEKRKNQQTETLKALKEEINKMNENKANIPGGREKIETILVKKFRKIGKNYENFLTVKALNDNLENIGASYVNRDKNLNITNDEVKSLIKKETLRIMEQAIGDIIGDPLSLRNNEYMQDLYKFLKPQQNTQDDNNNNVNAFFNNVPNHIFNFQNIEDFGPGNNRANNRSN